MNGWHTAVGGFQSQRIAMRELVAWARRYAREVGKQFAGGGWTAEDWRDVAGMAVVDLLEDDLAWAGNPGGEGFSAQEFGKKVRTALRRMAVHKRRTASPRYIREAVQADATLWVRLEAAGVDERTKEIVRKVMAGKSVVATARELGINRDTVYRRLEDLERRLRKEAQGPVEREEAHA